jgi:hypothetical protein
LIRPGDTTPFAQMILVGLSCVLPTQSHPTQAINPSLIRISPPIYISEGANIFPLINKELPPDITEHTPWSGGVNFLHWIISCAPQDSRVIGRVDTKIRALMRTNNPLITFIS